MDDPQRGGRHASNPPGAGYPGPGPGPGRRDHRGRRGRDLAHRDPGQADQRKALYQSELDTTLARHRALGALGVPEPVAQRQAVSQSEQERTLARHRALGALDAATAPPASVARPAARTAPAAPGPDSSMDVPATLLIGLVGGLLGGAAVVVGWTATTRRRRPRAVAGTSSH
jgi:hypothetical protein